MISLQPYHQVNEIKFQMTFKDVVDTLGKPDSELQGPNGSTRAFWGNMEIEFKNTNILSIAFNETNQFMIDGKQISLFDSAILQEKNPYFRDNTYGFPEWGIKVYNMDNYQNGFEMRFFPISLKDEFEQLYSTMPHYTDIKRKLDDPRPLFIVNPYSSVGPLKFGMRNTEVEALIGKAIDSLVIRGELREKRKNIGTVYNRQGGLIQASFENFEGVFFEGVDISKKGQLSEVVLDREPFINRSYTIYFDLGVAFQGFEKKNNIKTIVCFNEEKIDFWKNIHMPIF